MWTILGIELHHTLGLDAVLQFFAVNTGALLEGSTSQGSTTSVWKSSGARAPSNQVKDELRS